MFRISGDRLVFTQGSLLESEEGLRLETTDAVNRIMVYPKDSIDNIQGVKEKNPEFDASFDCYRVACAVREMNVSYRQVSSNRYILTLPENFIEGCKDVLLRISYVGDIGHAFIDGKLIHDNFYNGAVWEIGLRDFTEELATEDITIYITPLKKESNIHWDSPLTARIGEAKENIGELQSVELQPVYEIML